MAFSGALTLSDLNDFITPSQACIKPVEQTNVPAEKHAGAASTEIQVDSAGAYYEVSAAGPLASSSRKLEQAQINLNDCLACSGCITSAESVLITLQSHIEVLNFLKTNATAGVSKQIPVISIAPQSLSSIAASVTTRSGVATSPRQILRRIRHFCETDLGVEHVFDTTFARHVALREHLAEFEERCKLEGKLPMLASACPGWICYAEKTHPEMLPFIAQTKSPQQIMGTLVKNWMGQKWGRLPNEIYHVTVMPCYDKKLEASRTDFYNSVYSTRDVDCVITTGELELILIEKGYDITIPIPGESDVPPISNWSTKPTAVESSTLPELLVHEGSSSGSYLHSIISHLQSTSPTPLVLSVKTMRNADHEEYILRRENDQAEVFKGAKCYGFRNLQNVVRKVGKDLGIRTGTGAAGRLAGRAVARRSNKPGSDKPDRGYDYVEVMACPGGCVNGGGQLKPLTVALDEEGLTRDWEETGVMKTPKWGNREWTAKVESIYWSVYHLDYRPNRLLDWVLDDLCATNGTLDDPERDVRRRSLFRTSYRAVESDIVGLTVKW
ncbi:unnamed protein product [Mycena citricolor]|uniref:Iron hydrogenase large subunit C-terminal domain-containing protein n=1 Tax=Mycena citricolor TaxID=2018698 RepID=A0AAD2K8G3_9AGAR|nr:unnamed protein product [Mycena citricolor]